MKTSPHRSSRVVCSAHIHAWPGDFLDQPLPDGDWLVAHIRPRQDKLLTSYLARRSLPGLMFYERRVHIYPDHGSREYLVPMLGPYAFIHAGEAARDAIYASERLVTLITVRSPGEFTRDLGDLIALVQRAGAPPPMVSPELAPGVRVTVQAGPMAGLSGIIVRRSGRDRLVVNLPILGTSVSVELPAVNASMAVAESAEAPPA